MKDEVIKSLLADVSNFNLSMFGLAISVFTVLYAFILSRKDSLRDLNDLIKNGNATPFVIQRVAFFAVHTKKWRSFNNHLRNISIFSILLFFLTSALKYLPLNTTIKVFATVSFCLTGVLAVYILTILVLVFKNYTNTTRVD